MRQVSTLGGASPVKVWNWKRVSLEIPFVAQSRAGIFLF